MHSPCLEGLQSTPAQCAPHTEHPPLKTLEGFYSCTRWWLQRSSFCWLTMWETNTEVMPLSHILYTWNKTNNTAINESTLKQFTFNLLRWRPWMKRHSLHFIVFLFLIDTSLSVTWWHHKLVLMAKQLSPCVQLDAGRFIVDIRRVSLYSGAVKVT